MMPKVLRSFSRTFQEIVGETPDRAVLEMLTPLRLPSVRIVTVRLNEEKPK